MRRAIELAERGSGMVSPNPLVGAVIVDPTGAVVAEAFHRRAGEPHAEALALEAAGSRARGATLYCTLEPCAHFGRTPPCADAIIAAGIARVVVAHRDPNPVVDGRGLARLRAAGLDVSEGVLGEEAAARNRAFARHVTTGLPYVTWKIAASLDGRVAAGDGSSRWISGEAARADAHRLRAAADAIVVGSGTVLADDPNLTVRDPGYAGEPVLRVLLDGRGRIHPPRHVLDGQAPTLVATTRLAPDAARVAWRSVGAEVVDLAEDADGHPDVTDLLAQLGKRGVQAVMLEGGPTLAWAMLAADAIDRIVLYTAPILVGGTTAAGILGGPGFRPIADAAHVVIDDVRRIGDDLRVEAHVHGHR